MTPTFLIDDHCIKGPCFFDDNEKTVKKQRRTAENALSNRPFHKLFIKKTL